MDLIKELQKKYLKKNTPQIKSGDVVRVHQKIKEGKKDRIQIFEGIVIKTSGGNSLDATFAVRRKSFGIGVEMTFPLHSPLIVKIEKLKHIKVRRSKLYYLRNLTDKQIKRKGEFKEYAVWEEKESKDEEEKLKVQKEVEAKKKGEVKKKEQEELDKKFTQSRGKASSDTKDEKKSKEEMKDDSSKKESGE